MIAVTVVTPSYRHLEKEAVKRFKKNSGLPVHVIRCKDKDGFMKKLELDKECGRQRIVFFDVDFWLLRKVDFAKWDAFTIFAVHDSAVFNPHAFPHTDCQNLGLEKLRYFNSGFMVVNLALQSHRKVFAEARKLRKRVVSGKLANPTDVTDQFYLNKAAQDVGAPLHLVPLKFNFYLPAAIWGQVPYIPRDVIGLHAAGYKREEKLDALHVQSQVFGRENLIMCPEAYHFETSRIFDMR